MKANRHQSWAIDDHLGQVEEIPTSSYLLRYELGQTDRLTDRLTETRDI